jgi:hypothetical protein
MTVDNSYTGIIIPVEATVVREGKIAYSDILNHV